jgi:hypothetical protein
MDIVEDVADAAALLLDDDANAVITTIKMKLANFVTQGLRSLIDTVVLKSNTRSRGYMFSNFPSLGSEGQPGFCLSSIKFFYSVSPRDDHEHTCQDGASRHA